jgi:beta-N-acetylhexosaminidase
VLVRDTDGAAEARAVPHLRVNVQSDFMHRWLSRFVRLLAILSVALSSDFGFAATAPAPKSQTTSAQSILAAMTPAERVGQLFVVGFYGASAAPGSGIYDLIADLKVGSVLISAADDNITDTLQAPTQVLSLTNQLQADALASASIPRTEGGNSLPPYVPLLIAVNHEGDGYPFTDIQSGVTALPNEMAIGATWDPTQAETIGRIVGTEMSAMGVNMLLGPSLDVLETPRPEGADLGTRVFGGDPYWVGLMGQAYIRGVHSGANGQVAAVAKHFPGHGGSDRRPDQELPTVRKSLDDLKNFDLVPFYAVTGNAPNADSAADGVLDAHIRFQGFQGNIRQNTAPVSFDAQALGQLLGLPPIASWRSAGGVTVSDSLGARAIKSFYDPTLQQFQNRRIARDAFNAGNDLLLLSDFGLNPRSEQTTNIVDTITYFRQQYQADQNFAASVNGAVLRILNLKLRLYGGQFDPAQATRPLAGLNALNQNQAVVMAVAQASAALVSPPQDVLGAPEPPTRAQHIAFFTDVRQGQQCSTCPKFPLLDKRQLEQVVTDLYGRGGNGQVSAGNLVSFSFDDLAQYLQAAPATTGDQTPTPQPSTIETALQQSDWLVFAMLNVTPDVPSSGVVSAFLAQRPDMVRNKKIIVFAFNAPYYLDTTDLSKLTAFYALYSHAPAFVTVAAHLLFRDITPHGAPPVSVPGIGYKLIDVTRPDPKQVIALDWKQAPRADKNTPQAPGLRLGDTITLTTGVIHDLNGHPVPDQTPVHFRVLYTQEGLPDTIDAATTNGIATTTFQLSRTGLLEITVSSEPALSSTRLQIPVQQGTPFSVTEISPTSPPTPTATVTPSPTPVPPTPTLTPAPVVTPVPPPAPPLVEWRSFFVMLLTLAAVLTGGYRLGTLEEPQARLGIRVALAGAIGVLVGYNYLALSLPGADLGYLWLGVLAAPIYGLLVGIVGLAAGWYWFVGRVSRPNDAQ